MDKYEYKIRSEQIKELISQGEYVRAAEIADTIDWRRVKSVMMLCMISDLYKINRRFEDARDLLLLAYERHPGDRRICYSLCELSIKMEEFVQAVEYYKEFVQAAPKDTGRYILQYKLYEAQDVSLEERIAVLEELKKREYREKWLYELAYLYHRVGLATRCVEECDELILWFGNGKYVIKAMELKMLHEPLTPQQQSKYDNRFRTAEIPEVPAEPEEMEDRSDTQEEQVYEETAETADEATRIYGDEYTQAVESALAQETTEQEPPAEGAVTEEMDIHVKTVDVSQYNTINLQRELAEGLKEVLEADEQPKEEAAEAAEPQTDLPAEEETGEEALEAENQETQEPEEEMPEEGTEVFFGETGEIVDVQETAESEAYLMEEAESEEAFTGAEQDETAAEPIEEEYDDTEAAYEEEEYTESPEVDEIPDIKYEPYVPEKVEPEETPLPQEMAEVLSMGSDGQIRLVVPEEDPLEKQITGQLTIEEVLAEWERRKQEAPADYYEDEYEDEEDYEELEDSGYMEAQEPSVTENVPEETAAEPKPEKKPVKPEERDKAQIRSLSREEKELFGTFLQNRADRENLIKVLDNISLAAYTGNVIITGDEGLDTFTFAKNIVRSIQFSDNNFSGKTAKISGSSLDNEDVSKIFAQLPNGALIVEKASGMSQKSAAAMYKCLQQESIGIIVLLIDTKRAMNKFLAQQPKLAECFNARMDLEALDDAALVTFGKKYAREMEYSIDDLGMLALHTRIQDRQSSDHAVTIAEVKDIVDEAIQRANRKTVTHFCDILLAKRYDEEDMIILRERDFVS